MATKLILIRHAQTQGNFKKRYSGFMDISLNDEGRKQAAKLYKRLKKEEIHKVYSSDRKRAIQTAEIIFKGTKIEKIPHLREVHFGVFEGLTYKEIMERHPVIYKKWLNNPFSITIPKGEDLGNFKKRIVKALKKIVSLNKNKTIAVVSHGGAISIFINHILKSKDFWKQIPHPASLSIIEYKNRKRKIKLLNDTAHLSKDITYGARRAT